MALADNIKRLRKNKGWSQTDLAKKIDSHLSNINRIETGKYNPSVDVLVKMATVFEVSLDYLVSESDGEPQEIKIEDEALAERIRLLNTLEGKDRETVINVIDSILTKRRMQAVLQGEQEAS